MTTEDRVRLADRAEHLAHALWTAEIEDKESLVDGRRRKTVWQELVDAIRGLR